MGCTDAANVVARSLRTEAEPGSQLGRTTPSSSYDGFEASRVCPRTRLDARDPECGSTSLDKLFRRLVSISSSFKMFRRMYRGAILRRKFMEKNEEWMEIDLE